MTRLFSSLLKKYDEEKHGQHQKDIFPNIVHPFSIFTFIKQIVKQDKIFVMQDSLAVVWSSFFSFPFFSFSSFPFFCDADPVALQTVRGRGRLPPTRRLPPH